MKKFTTIDTISIKLLNGERTVRINGSKINSYDINGASFLASEIESLEHNVLGYFNPILVSFDENYIKDTGNKHLETLTASIRVVNENMLEVFVTFTEPNDIEDSNQREAFQLALEQVVAADKRLELYTPVRVNYTKALRKKLQKLKNETAEANPAFDFSEIGMVQFTATIAANTFAEAFATLEKIALGLEKKARKAMKLLQQP